MFFWWDHKDSVECVQYNFGQAETVSSASVYWWDDRAAGGECAVPESWTLLYNDNGQWVVVDNQDNYNIETDKYNIVNFVPVETDAVRLQVQLRDSLSGGILEWKVE